MTPKEKAIELVDKFKSLEIEVAAKYQGYGESCNYIEMQTFDAKDCALIAVDEIIDILYDGCVDLKYWQEVKQEIEKL